MSDWASKKVVGVFKCKLFIGDCSGNDAYYRGRHSGYKKRKTKVYPPASSYRQTTIHILILKFENKGSIFGRNP